MSSRTRTESDSVAQVSSVGQSLERVLMTAERLGVDRCENEMAPKDDEEPGPNMNAIENRTQ